MILYQFSPFLASQFNNMPYSKAGEAGSSASEGRRQEVFYVQSSTIRGLDGRHRDANGEIRRKNGNTEVGTLRDTYGDDFAAGSRSDMKLSTLLNRTGVESLSAYLRSDKPPVS